LETITDNLDAAQNVAYEYDANGNTTRKTKAAVETAFHYDIQDQLGEVRQDTNILGRYGYDYSGRRILKIGDEGRRHYTYDQLSVVTDADDTNSTVSKYDYGLDQLVCLNNRNEGRSFFHLDVLRSTVNLTDGFGSARQSILYDAWGNERDRIGASANKFTYTGHELDEETGLIYAKARFFDPDVGRFLSQDPLLGKSNEPPSLHRYTYAWNRPTFWSDPTGYTPEDLAGQEGSDAKPSFGESAIETLDNLVTWLEEKGEEWDEGTVTEEETTPGWKDRILEEAGRAWDWLVGERAEQGAAEAEAWLKKKWGTADPLSKSKQEAIDVLTEELGDEELARSAAHDPRPIKESLAEHGGYATEIVIEEGVVGVAVGVAGKVVDKAGDLNRGRRARRDGGAAGPAPPGGRRWSKTTTPWQRKVYKRSDINWDLKRPDGLTNWQAARKGYAPMRKNPRTGKWEDITLHHANQDPRGAVVEVWRSTHGKAPHQMDPPGNWRKARPDWDRAWRDEQSAYWRWRTGAYDPPPTDKLYLPGDQK
jgi:RHS repeat-associated protein